MAEGREFGREEHRAAGGVAGRRRGTRPIRRSGANSVTCTSWCGADEQCVTLGGGHRAIGSTRDGARFDAGSADRNRFRPCGGING